MVDRACICVVALFVAIFGASQASQLRREYASFTIDTSEIIGDFWDSGGVLAKLQTPRLVALTRALGPALIRLGGTDADNTFWNVSAPGGRLPPVYLNGPRYSINSTKLSILCNFINNTDTRLVLGLNGGFANGTRDANNGYAWMPENSVYLLKALVHPTSSCHGKLFAVELSNEPNLFLETQKHILTGKQLAADYKLLRATLDSIDPNIKIAGVDVAYQIPIVGSLLPTTSEFLQHGGGAYLDFLTWHWYAMESKRCPFHGNFAPATQKNAISISTLDKSNKWASSISRLLTKYLVSVELWMGEMSLVSCGGAINITDSFAGTFWYLDELAHLAVQGHSVVFRQTLVGSRYGLIEQSSLKPLPDYWGNRLFRSLVGQKVLGIQINHSQGNFLRAYAFASALNESKIVVLVLNVSPHISAILSGNENVIVVANRDVTRVNRGRTEYVITASLNDSNGDPLSAKDVSINGGPPLEVGTENDVPDLVRLGRSVSSNLSSRPLVMPALSYAFLTI
jgi:heparanase|eukprot:Stramenopile-MAST_4_protein_2361